MKPIMTSIAASILLAAFAPAQPPRYTVTGRGRVAGGSGQPSFITNNSLSPALARSAASAGAGPLLYVVTFAGQFGTVNPTTGVFTQIGPVTMDPLGGLVPGPNGYIGVSYSGNLDSINPATGAISVIGATGLGDLAFDTAELNGTVYATDLNNNLYTINTATGASSLIGPTGLPPCPSVTNPADVGDEALITVGGKLYATFDGYNLTTMALVDAPKLYQINPTTGVATLVGPTALEIDAATEVNGTVYAFTGFNQVLTLDLSTGNTALVGNYDPTTFFITGAAATLTVVSGASFESGPLAPNSIAAAFGECLLSGGQTAYGTLPLPTMLAGITVTVQDTTGTSRLAPLYFASNDQINFLVPAATAPGSVTVTLGGGSPVTPLITQTQVAAIAPALFTERANIAAAYAIQAAPGGTETMVPIFSMQSGTIVPTPIDLTQPGQVYLILFGTGFDGANAASTVATVQGVSVPVTYSGSQPSYAGLDQINLRLPQSLAGTGIAGVSLSIGGETANTVLVTIK